MNRIIISLFVLFISFGLFGQITITSSDMPEAGDTLRISTSVDAGMINFEETGNDYNWDFSSLNPLSQRVDTFLTVGETPWLYQLVFFTSANLAQAGLSFDQIPGFEVTDYFNYYKNSSSDFREVGFGITFTGIPVPNKYDEPDKVYQFPVEAGNSDSSYSTHSMTLPSLGYFGGWKKRVNYADGWGTLITPFGTFETLRVKSIVHQYDSLFLDSLGLGIPIYQEYIEYKWLGNGFGLPLCSVKDDGILQSVTYIDSLRNLAVGIPETESHVPAKVFPNPAIKDFSIQLSLDQFADVQISMFNIHGKLEAILFDEFAVPEKKKMNFNVHQLNLKPGLYFLNISVNGSVSNRKLIIQSN